METTSNETTHRFEPASAGTLRQVMDRDSANMAEELLAVLLHDLRSPLGAIGVLADLITSATEIGNNPEPRQVQLLQEAVTKAQRVLDDAVEIQSVIRGSSSFTPALVEARTIVRNSLEKAIHAPYFRNVQVEYENDYENEIIRVDFEKAETAVLCALEHATAHADRPSPIRIYYTAQRPFINVHIVNEQPAHEPPVYNRRPADSLKGRLGTRRLGESRFNMIICSQVMDQMGGRLEHSTGEFGRIIILKFPMAID